jgi:ABC-type multidrug transport system fused ATPase/permease subunit
MRLTEDKALRWGVGFLAVLVISTLLLLIVGFSKLHAVQAANHHETQTSRFNAAYISCLNSNASNRLANVDILKVFAHPSSETYRRELLNDLRPLRVNARPVVQLPAHIPASWVVGCSRYATTQVATIIPPQVPHVTATTTTTATKTKTGG